MTSLVACVARYSLAIGPAAGQDSARSDRMTPTAEPHRCSAEIVKQHRTGAGPDLWTLLALFLRGLGDRPDELPRPLALLERDVSLRDHADEPIVLDNGQPPNLVAGHQSERLVEVAVRLDADEVARVDVPD